MNTDEYEAFCEEAMLNKKHDPYVRSRDSITGHYNDGMLEFGMFEIISCQHPEWWYNRFIGIQFLGLFPGKYGARDVHPTRSIGHTRIVWGNGIPMQDVKLI